VDKNWTISFIRTIVAPFIVGCFSQLLIFAWSDDVPLELRAGVASLFAAAWYIIARLLAIWNPKLGFLLIVAAVPHYVEDDHEKVESDLLVSIIRTVVPLAVGWGVGWAVKAGFDIDEQTLVLLFQGLITGGYYGILRWIEERSKPESTARQVSGLMLGAPAVPHY
jgi:ABC-type iron transport system FetAB permease component